MFDKPTAKRINSKEYQLLMAYRDGILKGEISPLTGLTAYRQAMNAAQRFLVGKTTSKGIKIKSIHSHLINRILGGSSRLGVPLRHVEEALLKPIRVTTQVVRGDKRHIYWSKRCKVVVSVTDGRVIQTNPWRE